MPLVTFSLLRLGLFAAALGLLWWVGMGGWLLVVVAAVVAWTLSYLLLAGPRDDAARWIADRAQARRESGVRFSGGVEADAAAEDLIVDGPATPDRDRAPDGDHAPDRYPASDRDASDRQAHRHRGGEPEL